jgi:hypothetical protein
MNFMTFQYIGNFIIPTDDLIFSRGVGLNHQAVLLENGIPQPNSRSFFINQQGCSCFTAPWKIRVVEPMFVKA